MTLKPLAPGLTLRRAVVDDAQALSILAMRTFVETFGHLYPRGDLDLFLAETYCVQSQRALLAAPDHAVWLLEHSGTCVGYALAGPCTLPHPEIAPGDGELKRLYVIKPLQSHGLGAHLMQAVMDWLLRDGPRTLWLGVWSENHSAQRFYARYGFSKAGEYLFRVGQTCDREWIFKRPLLPAATRLLDERARGGR